MHGSLAPLPVQVMMGDDTWMQLAQDAFAEAYPYPSFNVHDLHTVDDGVWEVRRRQHRARRSAAP